MPNTSEGFYYPDANTNIAPLETVLANMAASSDSVAQQTPRVFANYAAMVAGIPSPVGGRLAITTQGSGILWQYDGTAAKWVVQNRPTFSGATARDAAIPSPTSGVAVVIGSGATYSEYVHDGTAWRAWTTPWQAITPAAGFTGAPYVRIAGGLATFRGDLTGTVPATTGTQVGTVPAGFRPAYSGQGYSAAGDGQTGLSMVTWIDTNGAIWVYKQSSGGACTLSLGSLNGYSLS